MEQPAVRNTWGECGLLAGRDPHLKREVAGLLHWASRRVNATRRKSLYSMVKAATAALFAVCDVYDEPAEEVLRRSRESKQPRVWC